MNRFVLSVLFLLCLGGTCSAEPSTAAANDPVSVVQAFQAARDKHDTKAAYALLRFGDGTPMTFDDYVNSDLGSASRQPGWQTLGALFAYLFFAKDSSDYTFEPQDLMPGKADAVRIHVMPGPGSTAQPFDVQVVVTSSEDGKAKIDVDESAYRANPVAVTAAREKAKTIWCTSNLKQLGLSILQYAQDHDETFPDADRWMDEIKPYIGTDDPYHVFRCPADKGHEYSYSFNRSLSHKSIASIGIPADVVLVFESSTGRRNQSDYGTSLPAHARHRAGYNYVMADGHAVTVPEVKKQPKIRVKL